MADRENRQRRNPLNIHTRIFIISRPLHTSLVRVCVPKATCPLPIKPRPGLITSQKAAADKNPAVFGFGRGRE